MGRLTCSRLLEEIRAHSLLPLLQLAPHRPAGVEVARKLESSPRPHNLLSASSNSLRFAHSAVRQATLMTA